MLPNVGNFDELVSDFVEDERKNTQTFGITRLTVPVDPNEMNNIGEIKLGVTRLNRQWLYEVRNKIDGLEALRQNIRLLLNIEADQYIIYPYTYGVKTLDLIGKPPYYVIAVLPDRIKEALLSDNRIIEVSDFDFEVTKNKVHAKFIVHTTYGDLDEETVVSY